uniref:CC domain-containing protein n=1 Tax=Romanomermis culicivorax TaxID=13658 RepID=A0A915HQQ1_ROMCU
MECPPNAVFNSFLQTCTSVYSTVVNGSSFLSSAIVYDFPSCPDGSRTNLFCQAGICPRDYDCYNGGCCPKPALTIAMDPRVRKFCPDGLEATFPCRSNEECADGYTCAEIGSTSFCCREKHNALNLRQQFVSYQNNCPGPVTPYTSVLLCATGSQCPGGNVCPTAGFCCPSVTNSPTQPATICLDGSTPLGPCLNGNCFAPGYTCQNGLCCKTNIVGPVLPQPGSGCSAPIAPTPHNPSVHCVPGSLCPNGSPCPSNGVCCTPSYQNCPDGSQSAGQCANSMQCVPGYTCQNGACCRSTGLCPDNSPAFGVCSPSGACGFGMSCTPNGLCCSTASQLCPDNSQPAGACINGFCGAGFTCVANLNYCCRSSGSVANINDLFGQSN